MPGWGRALGIRPGEGRTVLAFAGLFAAMEAGGGFGEVGVDTLAVSRYGAGIFPYLFIGLGTLSLVAALVYGAALGPAATGPVPVRAPVRCGPHPPRRTDPDGDRPPADGAAGLADGLRHRGVRGDDRLDDGRLRLRCPAGEAPLPAVYRGGHRRSVRRDPVVGADRVRHRHREPARAPGRDAGRGRGDHPRDRADRHRARAGAPARRVGPGRASGRLRWRRQLPAHAPRRARVRPARRS